MSNPPTAELESWESESGAPERSRRPAVSIQGSEGRVEWALSIRRQVNQEFDRVAAAFRVVADRQKGEQRLETEIIIAILEEKRSEVMSREDASYFIRGWQEISDQVRLLIFNDPRYAAIKKSRCRP